MTVRPGHRNQLYALKIESPAMAQAGYAQAIPLR